MGGCRPVPDHPSGELAYYCSRARLEHGLAGLALARVVAGRPAEIAVAGSADIHLDVAISPDTRFRIASLTKPFTALALMQLWQSGELDLDAPVNRYLRGFCVEGRPHPDAVTARHLLTHTAGLGELRKRTDWLRPSELLTPRHRNRTPVSVTEYYAPALRATQPAGTKWSYSDHGFRVLGQLVADISGIPYGHYISENIFRPLGMSSSFVGLDDAMESDMAIGYAPKSGTLKPVVLRQAIGPGSGGIVSSIRDLATFASALIFNDLVPVRRATLMQMWRPHFRLAGVVGVQGLGFQIRHGAQELTVEHGGGFAGFGSQLVVNTERNVAVVALMNTTALLAPPVITDEVLHAHLGTPPPHRLLPASHDPAAWTRLPGRYRPTPGFMTNIRTHASFGGQARVDLRPTGLWLSGRFGTLARPRQLIPVDPYDPLVFSMPWERAALRCQFVNDPAGNPISLVIGGLNLDLRRDW